MPPEPVIHYLAASLRARLIGLAFIGAGVGVLLVVVLGWLLSAPLGVLSVLVAVVVLAAVGAGLLLSRRQPVLRLDAGGYQVSLVRGSGTKAARWDQVEQVQVHQAAAGSVLLIGLRDGRATRVPLGVLDVSEQRLVEQVRGFLPR